MTLDYFKTFQTIYSFFICFLLISCEETLFETDISETNLELIAPSDGSVISFTSINFDWEPLIDANRYQLQIATPNFDNPIQIIQDVLLDSISTFDAQLNPNIYQWRVKGINSAYETSYTTASFEIRNNEDFSDNVIVLNNPQDNLIINTNVFNLEWSSVLDATGYRIQIIDNSNGQTISEQTTSETNIQYTFLEGDFSWQVRAEKDAEFTGYSGRMIFVDQTAPNASTLTTPEDEVTLTSGNVNFSWSRTPISGSTEIDSLYIYSDLSMTVLVEKEQVVNDYLTTLDNRVYYWTMKAFDGAGNQSGDSTTFSFTVDQ